MENNYSAQIQRKKLVITNFQALPEREPGKRPRLTPTAISGRTS